MINILFLDDSEERHIQLKKNVDFKNANVVLVYTAKEAIDAIEKTKFDAAFLDHDLGGKIFVTEVENTGYEVALHIEQMPAHQRPDYVFLHSHNPAGISRMKQALEGSVKGVIIVMFGSNMFFQYFNRITAQS